MTQTLTPAFADLRDKAWPFSYQAVLSVVDLVGGTPSDPNVAEGWIRSKMGEKSEQEIQRLVAQVKEERGVDTDEAIRIANQYKNLNGFRRDANGLYIEGRQMKAAIKEAASCAVAVGKLERLGWGETRKALAGFLAEHVFVPAKRIYLLNEDGTNVTSYLDDDKQVPNPAITVQQRFVSTFRGTGIQYEEVVAKVRLEFEVRSDYGFSQEEWGMIWLTGEQQGVGASRSQSYGTYTVMGWDPIDVPGGVPGWATKKERAVKAATAKATKAAKAKAGEADAE